MGMPTDRVVDSISEFTNLVGTNHLSVGEMQVGRFGRMFDLECERKWNLYFSGPTRKTADKKPPLADRLHCGVEKERIAGNSFQANDGTVNANNQDKLDHSLLVFKPSLSWINGLHEVREQATQLILCELNAREFRARLSALGRCLRKESQQKEMKNNERRHKALIARKNNRHSLSKEDGVQSANCAAKST